MFLSENVRLMGSLRACAYARVSVCAMSACACTCTCASVLLYILPFINTSIQLARIPHNTIGAYLQRPLHAGSEVGIDAIEVLHEPHRIPISGEQMPQLLVAVRVGKKIDCFYI